MESAYGQDYYQSPSDAIYRPHNRALIVLSHVLYKEKHTPKLMAYIGMEFSHSQKKCLSHVLYKEKHTPTLMAYIGNFHIPK